LFDALRVFPQPGRKSDYLKNAIRDERNARSVVPTVEIGVEDVW